MSRERETFRIYKTHGMESTMTHFYAVATLIATCAFTPAAAAIEGPSSTHDEFVAQTLAKIDRLEHLIRAHQDTEQTFLNEQKHLQEIYGDLDSTNVYQDIDLTSMDGIRKSRERLKNLNTKIEQFAAAQKQSRTAWQERVSTADVDEPLRSELKDYFSTVSNKRRAEACLRIPLRRIKTDLRTIEVGYRTGKPISSLPGSCRSRWAGTGPRAPLWVDRLLIRVDRASTL